VEDILDFPTLVLGSISISISSCFNGSDVEFRRDGRLPVTDSGLASSFVAAGFFLKKPKKPPPDFFVSAFLAASCYFYFLAGVSKVLSGKTSSNLFDYSLAL
jgi:hypothetical protein